MHGKLALLALFALVAAACHPRGDLVSSRRDLRNPEVYREHDSHDAVAIFGHAQIENTVLLCAGRATLSQGSATVSDGCFSGDSNIVLCTDMSNPNPIKCTPGTGTLSVAGSGNDVISYARVR